MGIINVQYGLKIKNILYRFKVRKKYKELNRETDGFIFYTHGGHSFQFKNTTYQCKQNEFIYLPAGAQYENTCSTESTEFYQIDFTIYKDGKVFNFSENPFILSTEKAESLLPLISKIYSIHCSSNISKDVICIGLIYQLFVKIKTIIDETASSVSTSINIQKSISYIEKNFCLNTDIKAIAEMSYTSLSNLEKSFKKLFGMSPLKYRNSLRINRAKILLLGGKSISETAIEVGFSDVYYFTKTFKSLTGKTPGQFIKNNDIVV
jgi:AraC-like DNA-binding protein